MPGAIADPGIYRPAWHTSDRSYGTCNGWWHLIGAGIVEAKVGPAATIVAKRGACYWRDMGCSGMAAALCSARAEGRQGVAGRMLRCSPHLLDTGEAPCVRTSLLSSGHHLAALAWLSRGTAAPRPCLLLTSRADGRTHAGGCTMVRDPCGGTLIVILIMLYCGENAPLQQGIGLDSAVEGPDCSDVWCELYSARDSINSAAHYIIARVTHLFYAVCSLGLGLQRSPTRSDCSQGDRQAKLSCAQ